MKPAVVLLYAVTSYLFCLLVLAWSIGFLGNVYVARSIDSAATVATQDAFLTNALLLLVFALQHSGMARPAFRRFFSRWLPEAAERSSYVLLSSLCLGLILLCWQPLGGVIWSIEDAAVRIGLQCAYLAGWVFLFWSSCLHGHAHFLGLAQAWAAYHGRVYIAPRFATPGAYRVVRHPVYLGWLLVLWATPTMTLSHLALSAGLTAYTLVGICLEERDLLRRHASYAQYRRKVPALVPSLRRYLRPRGKALVDS